MSENRKWYVVHTRPGIEKKLAESLTRKRLESYCPINIRSQHEHRKPVHEPLFPAYVFVRTYEHKVDELKNIHGVINLVHWLGKPATVDAQEILAVKKFMNEHATVWIEKTDVNLNGEVKLDESSYLENTRYMPFAKNKFTRLLLPSLGYLILAESKTTNLEVRSVG